ncbi:MAG: carboxypeptidase-like regulatory domain-containing protein [Patiriisocius sp.]|uniref:vWA domain-containing protein n=1 Tax=Patiriisocius sp. TaxID=2822396 RepID=UPI003EF9FD54
MKILLYTLLLAIVLPLQAQQITINGTVTDDAGLPLPGVNVLERGTTNGTQADFDGNYSINISVGSELVFSYVGFDSKAVKISGRKSVIDVSLVQGATLNEVVITGYGGRTRERNSLGYAVSRIETESIDKRKGIDVVRTLNGKVSGIEIIKGKDMSSKSQSGLLTAAEINDNENWKSYKKNLLANQNEGYNVVNRWDFLSDKRIVVEVVNLNNKAIQDIKVQLFSETDQIDIARTDVFGKAIFLRGKANKLNQYSLQILNDGKIYSQKISNNKEVQRIVVSNEKEQTKDIDIMFTIDATGSMGDEMQYLKVEVENIMSRLDKSISRKRLALTFYRDNGDAFVVSPYNFNEDISLMKKVLLRYEADGGGDYEEAVEEALKVSIAQSWNEDAKTKIIFLLLDAPPHFNEQNITTMKHQIKKAREKGIKIIPIVASNANKELEFLMRYFSVATNGTYVFLTDDSGVGNTHLKPTTDDYTVEKLNDLIVRLIEKYAGVQKITI